LCLARHLAGTHLGGDFELPLEVTVRGIDDVRQGSCYST